MLTHHRAILAVVLAVLAFAFVLSAMSTGLPMTAWVARTGQLSGPESSVGIAVRASRGLGTPSGPETARLSAGLPHRIAAESGDVRTAGTVAMPPGLESPEGFARTTAWSRGTSLDDAAVRATSPRKSSDDPTASETGAMPVAPSSAPRAILIARGSPLTVDRDAQDVELAIVEAAREWNIDGAKMLALAWCESRFNPNAIGDGGLALSVFQWHATTWRQYASALDYEVRDIFDVVAQARLTSWAIANGRGYLWTCWR